LRPKKEREARGVPLPSTQKALGTTGGKKVIGGGEGDGNMGNLRETLRRTRVDPNKKRVKRGYAEEKTEKNKASGVQIKKKKKTGKMKQRGGGKWGKCSQQKTGRDKNSDFKGNHPNKGEGSRI